MPKPATWVVKLGGSLQRDAALPAWLEACRWHANDAAHCVVVAGGGLLADGVRELHARWGFDEAAAHALAMDAMAMSARLFTTLAGRALLFSGTDARNIPRLAAHTTVWLPTRPYRELGLAASWDVTSDSIALRLAERLGAAHLVLVKSLDQADFPDPERRLEVKSDLVDRAFRGLAQAGDVTVRVMARDEAPLLVDAIRRG